MYNNKICGIYKITNTINNKVIIGQSVNILNRWKSYKGSLRSGHYSNQHLQEAWSKDGEQNFKFEVILECPKEDLNKEEKRLIKEYKTDNRNFGYNIEAGGNLHCSDETRKKLSESAKLRKGWFAMSEEQKKKISRTMKGHVCSKETKEKISHRTKNKKVSNETKKKISNSKINSSYRGEKHWNYGKKCSGVVRQKISESNKGKHVISEETRKRMSESHLKANKRLGVALKWAKLPNDKRKTLIERYTSNALI
jgi:group I intron endonuclease